MASAGGLGARLVLEELASAGGLGTWRINTSDLVCSDEVLLGDD